MTFPTLAVRLYGVFFGKLSQSGCGKACHVSRRFHQLARQGAKMNNCVSVHSVHKFSSFHDRCEALKLRKNGKRSRIEINLLWTLLWTFCYGRFPGHYIDGILTPIFESV